MTLDELKTEKLIVKSGKKLSLKDCPTRIDNLYSNDDEAHALILSFQEKVREYQERLYAEAKQSLLIIIQGTDTSGKDGLVEHLMTGINPQGVSITSFKRPSDEELAHDFMWRSICNLPKRGMIGIFNRSYYEEVIVTRVHPEFLEAQNLSKKASQNIWEKRFEGIRDFEKYLTGQGWKIVKLFLHISHKEQKQRLLKRINDPDKHWKFDPNDLRDREHWTTFQRYYAECFSETSTKHAPWYVVPADDKKNARLMASEIILEALEEMDPQFPKSKIDDSSVLRKAKRTLEKEK